jgi:hypothetical protein
MKADRIIKAVVVSAFFSATILTLTDGGIAQEEAVEEGVEEGVGEGMVATVQSVQDDLKLAQLQSEATEKALNELAISDVLDLQQAFQEFSTWVASMQDTGNRLVAHADQMHYTGASYLVESGQTPTACAFPRLRLPQDSPQAQLGEYFDAVADETWKVKRAYRAFELDITQINETLGKNLTPRSLDNLRQMVRKTRVDADSFQEALTRAQVVLERAKLASQTAPVAPS